MDSMTRLGALIVVAFRAAVANKKTLSVATALGLAIVAYGIWLDWEWKAMIGWKALVDYINPARDDTTGKKDAVQVYAVIVAGVIASITAAVGLLNLRLTRKNLEQQRELEAQRAQGTALQAYYEQIGNLLTEYDLRNTQREEIKELARGQTLTVLQEVDGNGKGNLLTFLHGAGLIGTENLAVALTGADLQGVILQSVDLRGANLREADLFVANLKGANLKGADLLRAILFGANLQGATMPDGSEHP
jgi:type II secretory pathway pseudopilin PulG